MDGIWKDNRAIQNLLVTPALQDETITTLHKLS